MNITVSDHALQRATERLGCTAAEARALLCGPKVQAAANFGARVVRCAGGRIVLAFTPVGATVLTVLPLNPFPPRQLRPASWGGPPPVAADPFFQTEEQTMPRDTRTPAEKLRRHREAFTLALELGCTPREAEDELARREARKRHETGARALAAKMNAPLPKPLVDPEPPRAPWWQD